jgi:hypothetical protein
METKAKVMYLGPRLHRIGLGYGAIFKNGIHPALQSSIDACPAIAELMIPIEQVGAVRKELMFDYAHNMRGTTGKYVTFYREIQNWLAKQAGQQKTPTVEIKHHA